MRRLLSILMILLLHDLPLQGGDGSFVATVDKTRAAPGDQIEITFTLSGSNGGKSFRPPAFTDFLVLAGPNQSTNMQFINGVVSSSVSYTYVLQPRSEGKFTIAPAAIEYNGKQLQTQPVGVEVVKGAARPNGPAGQSAAPDIARQIADNLYVQVTVDKSRVVKGEQLVVTYRLYNRVNLVNIGIGKVPALTGFFTEDLEVPKQIQFSNEVVNGKAFQVAVLKKAALFPQQSGPLEIDPLEANCVVQVQTKKRSNNVFDQFFNDPFFGNVSNVEYKAASKPVKITVAPLPDANVPADFRGAVGKYAMEAWLDRSRTRANDPVTLRVKISGRGNLKLLQPPNLTVTPDIEQYDPKISDAVSKEGDQIAGSRTFEYLLVPRRPGDQKISSFPFSYYDIEKKNYVTFRSPEFILTVEKASDFAPGPSTGISKEDVKLLGEDIRFIKSGEPSLRRRGETFSGSAAFYALAGSPPAAFVAYVLLLRRRRKLTGDAGALRNRKARKIARRRLVRAKKFLDEKKKVEFYFEVSRALWGYVADKLGIPPSDLSVDSIRSSLERRSVPGEVVAKLASAIDRCEFARFAPAQDSLGIDGMYRDAIELISAIEDNMR